MQETVIIATWDSYHLTTKFMLKRTYTIEATFGSKFQEEINNNSLQAMLKALGMHMQNSHKGNKLIIKISPVEKV